MAAGLHWLHSHRIVHFDVKSQNILLARDGTAKISDVGLARILHRHAALPRATSVVPAECSRCLKYSSCGSGQSSLLAEPAHVAGTLVPALWMSIL